MARFFYRTLDETLEELGLGARTGAGLERGRRAVLDAAGDVVFVGTDRAVWAWIKERRERSIRAA